MPKLRPLGKTELTDILNGATILGSGGGGPYAVGQQIISYLAQQSQPVMVVDPAEVGDEQRMAVSAAVGSPDAAGSAPFPMDVAPRAFNALIQRVGQAFDCVLPGELGATNSFIPMTVASQLGIPIVDASGAPRAMPTLTMASYAAHNAPISPIVVSSPANTIVLNATDAATAEGPLRGIVAGGGFGEFAGVAFWSMSGKVMRDSAILNTLSYAQALGCALREALGSHHDPVQAVCQFLKGRVVFTGKLIDPGETTQGGFDYGVTILQGAGGASAPAQAMIYNMNENLIAWNLGSAKPLVMGPDLICYLTLDGQPFSNAELSKFAGRQVALIAAPCELAYRQPGVIAAWLSALQGLGYGGPYVPVEQLWQ